MGHPRGYFSHQEEQENTRSLTSLFNKSPNENLLLEQCLPK